MANAATKRLALIGGAVAVVGVGVYLMLSAFNDNLVFFYSPMQVAAKEAPQGRTFRMGGMVEEGSVKRLPDGLTVTFGITDTAAVSAALAKKQYAYIWAETPSNPLLNITDIAATVCALLHIQMPNGCIGTPTQLK